MGLLLHYHQHVAPRKTAVVVEEGVSDDLLRAHLEKSSLRYEPGSATGMRGGLRDDHGWLALIDVDEFWHPAVVGCHNHEGQVELDRDDLWAVAEAAARDGRMRAWRVSPRH